MECSGFATVLEGGVGLASWVGEEEELGEVFRQIGEVERRGRESEQTAFMIKPEYQKPFMT